MSGAQGGAAAGRTGGQRGQRAVPQAERAIADAQAQRHRARGSVRQRQRRRLKLPVQLVQRGLHGPGVPPQLAAPPPRLQPGLPPEAHRQRLRPRAALGARASAPGRRAGAAPRRRPGAPPAGAAARARALPREGFL